MSELDEAIKALELWNDCFGYCQLDKCIGRWNVSNKTDEGLGGHGPSIAAEGSTPEEAIIAAHRFLKDPKIPASFPCPSCGQPLTVDEYVYNCSSMRMQVTFRCHDCWDSFMGDDICPDCYGELAVVDHSDGPTWDTKCARCGKAFLRGSIALEHLMVFPKWKFETLDFGALARADNDK